MTDVHAAVQAAMTEQWCNASVFHHGDEAVRCQTHGCLWSVTHNECGLVGLLVRAGWDAAIDAARKTLNDTLVAHPSWLAHGIDILVGDLGLRVAALRTTNTTADPLAPIEEGPTT